MKFNINKPDFIKTLQRMQGIVEKRNTMPILSNILLETKKTKIDITATDLEIYIKDSTLANINEEGSVTINARKIFEIIKELPEDNISISTTKEDKMTIKSGKARFTVMGLSAKDFPVFPVFDDVNLEKLDDNILKELIDKTSFAVSTDETRYNINGFLFEKDKSNIKMVSTDGHRLALVEKKGVTTNAAEKKSVLIPRKGMMEIRKALDEKIGEFLFGVSQKNAVMKKEDTLINIRLLEGEFPDYNKVIPTDNNKNIIIDKAMILSSLKRVSILSSDKIKGVKFNFVSSRLTLSSSSPDIGDATEDIDIDYKGEDIEIAFNARYFIDCLETIDEEKIQIKLKDPLSPGIIRSAKDGDYTYIIMPMRL